MTRQAIDGGGAECVAQSLFLPARARNGNTGQLIDRIAGELQIEVIDLGDKNISAFDYEHRNRDDDFEPLIDYVLGYDQIIFFIADLLVFGRAANESFPRPHFRFA